jgi:hypothetical protein
LGEFDEKPFRPMDAAEPMHVFVLDDFAYSMPPAEAKPSAALGQGPTSSKCQLATASDKGADLDWCYRHDGLRLEAVNSLCCHRLVNGDARENGGPFS